MDVILAFPDNGDDSCKQFFLTATQIELDALPGIKVNHNTDIVSSTPVLVWHVMYRELKQEPS